MLRAHLRWGTYGPDDALAAIATALHGAEAAVVFFALGGGVGTSFELLSGEQISHASKDIFAANILFISASALTKCSVVFLAMRLFNLQGARASHIPKSTIYQKLCGCVIALVCIWAVGSIVGLCVRCSPATFIDPELSPQTCSEQVTRWAAIMAVDVLTEVLLVLLAAVIILPLQISLSMKWPVVLAFAFRLPCAALSVLHFVYIRNYVEKNPDGLSIIPVLNFMQVGLCWSLVSATIPNLKSFVKSFNSGFGLGLDVQTAYGTSSNGGRLDYQLSSRSRSGQKSQTRSRSESEPCERHVCPAATREAPNYGIEAAERGTIISVHEHQGSVGSVGSQEQIIRKDVRWGVSYEDVHAR